MISSVVRSGIRKGKRMNITLYVLTHWNHPNKSMKLELIFPFYRSRNCEAEWRRIFAQDDNIKGIVKTVILGSSGCKAYTSPTKIHAEFWLWKYGYSTSKGSFSSAFLVQNFKVFLLLLGCGGGVGEMTQLKSSVCLQRDFSVPQISQIWGSQLRKTLKSETWG